MSDDELRFWRATGKTRREEAEDSTAMLGCLLLGMVTAACLLILFGLAFLVRVCG